MVNAVKYPPFFLKTCLKLISLDLIFIENVYFMVRNLQRTRFVNFSFLKKRWQIGFCWQIGGWQIGGCTVYIFYSKIPVFSNLVVIPVRKLKIRICRQKLHIERLNYPIMNVCQLKTLLFVLIQINLYIPTLAELSRGTRVLISSGDIWSRETGNGTEVCETSGTAKKFRVRVPRENQEKRVPSRPFPFPVYNVGLTLRVSRLTFWEDFTLTINFLKYIIKITLFVS